MKRFKSVLCFLFVLLIVVNIMGCTKKDDTGAENLLPKEENSLPETKTEITVTHIQSDALAEGQCFRKIIDDFMVKYPNIKVNSNFIENSTYQETIHASIAADSLSEIQYTWQGAFSQHFIENDKVVYIDDDLGHLEKDLTDGALYRTNDGKMYAVAWKAMTEMLYVNNKIFKDLNLNVPTNWNELLNACKILRENDIIPIALNNNDGFPLHVLFDIIHYRIGGPDLVEDVFYGDGSVTFEHESYIDAARKIQELVDAKAFPESADVMSWDERFALFTNGKAAMMYTGSYGYSSILSNMGDRDKDEFLNDISIVNFPKIYEGDYNNVEQIYFSDGLLITTKATGPKKDASVKLLEYFASEENQKLGLQYGNLPIRAINMDSIELCPLFKKIVLFSTQDGTINRNIQQNRAPSTAFYDIFRSQISNAILTKSLTPEESMEKLSNLWVEQMKD